MNEQLFWWINNLARDFSFLEPLAIFLAKYCIYFFLLAIIVYWFSRKREYRFMIISGVIGFIIASLLARFVGTFHENFQPFYEMTGVNQLVDHVKDNSFPSDHTLTVFVYAMIFWLYKVRLRNLWIVLAILVGIGRIMVGVHYPADVLVGALIGIIAALGMYVIIPKIKLIEILLNFYEQLEEKVWPRKEEVK